MAAADERRHGGPRDGGLGRRAHAVAQQEARLLPGYDGALGFAVDPVVWTLSLEALFYLVLPLVAGWF